MNFWRENSVKSVRANRRCAWCDNRIEKVQSAISWASYTFDTDFGSGWMHPECRHALTKAWEIAPCGEVVEFGEYARGSTYNHGDPEFHPDGSTTQAHVPVNKRVPFNSSPECFANGGWPE